jgi:hypothetical protein
VAIFTLAATAILGAIGITSTFAIGVAAVGLSIAATYAVSAVMKSLSGQEDTNKPAAQDHFGTQGTLAAGGDVPRSFGLGRHMTAGSLVYANYWGNAGQTPNAYLTQVIAVSDLPREQLLEVWINGEKCTLSGPVDGNLGTAVAEYAKDGAQHLWIKYYDGTQTAVDPFLVGYVSSGERPYPSTRVGTGVAYVIATALVDDTLFTGFPTFKFVLSGIPLYDPSKDSTNGGSGSHRYSDPATWGGDGDQLPAVQAYNILRGIRYAGGWLYGLQNMTGGARLPAANWNAQIAKCRDLIASTSGTEPTYRAGGQINIDAQPANAIEALLTACQGRLSEIGGFYKIHLGAPDSPTFAWTDADLLSSESQVFRPFFSLADSVNGIQGTYPNPAEGWQTATAPPLYRTDLEARDGHRRLMAAPSFDMVPYPEQVQRLQKSGIEESQRARTHVLPFPPVYWVVEPGDVGTWNSVRNGYTDKLFRVDQVTDRANLDVVMNVTEVDPADYDWDHTTDYTGVATGPTTFPRPAPQGVVDWYAEGTILYDADGLGRRVAIRITWDGTLPGVVGIQYEVRLTADLSHVARGRTDQLAAGALLISQGLIPQTAYQVRGQYLPSSPRDMLWSDWLDVVTPEEPVADIPAWIAVQVTSVMDYLNDRLLEVEQRISTVTSTNGQRNWLDQKETRSQLSSRSDAAFAEISRVDDAWTAADAAQATAITNVDAKFGAGFSNVNTVQKAFADNAATFATYQTTVSATFGPSFSSVNSVSTAVSTINGWAAASYSLTLDVNGYATGFTLLNGGAGVSSTTFITDKFQIASPGVGGGAPVPIFTVANVGGTPKVALRGDMYVDGSIAGSKIIAGDITATQIAANTIDASKIVAHTLTANEIAASTITTNELAANSVTATKIAAFNVNADRINDGAITANNVAGLGSIATSGGSPQNVITMNVSLDTTGLAGKSMMSIAFFNGQQAITSGGANWSASISANGAGISGSATGGSTFQPNFTSVGIYNWTASGGVDTITYRAVWQGDAGKFTLQSGSLIVMAAKR